MHRIITIAVLIVALVACAAPTPEPTSEVPGYPAANVTPTLPGAGAIPTAASDRAVIHGVLLVDKSNPRPVSAAILYLADLVPETRGTPYLAAFERTTSPQTVTDGEGRFIFSGVPPASYGLVLDRLSDSFLLGDPEMVLDDFIFEARAGQVLDLGRLVYTELPGYEAVP